MNLFAGQQWRCRHREQACGHSGGRRGWDKIERIDRNMYITVCKVDSMWGFAVRHRGLTPVLCDNLEWWDGVGDGRGIWEGGDICILVAYS